MNEQPQVSVVIPCYNAAAYVADAICSALEQTYKPIEVVVVDDGSTDGSGEVLQSFGEAIRAETGPNRGGCAARNRGLELAGGPLVQFLDADDLLHPTKLERQVARLLESGADVVFCNGERVSIETSARLRAFDRPFEPPDPVQYTLSEIMPPEATLHWKDRLVAAGGFRVGLSASQDLEFHLRLACEGLTFCHLPEILYTKRVVAGSVSSNYVKAVAPQLSFLPEACEALRRRGELSEDRARAFAAHMARVGRGCMQRGATDVGLEFFRAAKAAHPGGGLPAAYTPPARLMYRIFGPVLTERLVQWKRGATSSNSRSGIAAAASAAAPPNKESHA